MSRRRERRLRKLEARAEIVLYDGDEMRVAAPPDAAMGARYFITRLTAMSDTGTLPVRMAFTSALRGEGVSFTTDLVGAVLSQDTSRRVLLVDANWWSDDDDDRIGLANVLLHDKALDEAIAELSLPNVFALHAGSCSAAERAMLAHDAGIEDVLSELEADFDHILIDLPSILETSDAVRLAKLADACALVVRAGITTVDQVDAALRELRTIKLAGVVLNDVTSSVPSLLRRPLGL